MMRSWEERRKEELKYEADVAYEVWRSHGDPGRISDDRIRDSFDRGIYPEEAARLEIQKQRPEPSDAEDDFQTE